MAVYQEWRKWGHWDSEIKLQSLIDRTGQKIVSVASWVLLVCLMMYIKLYKGINVFGHLVTFNAKFLCHLILGWRRESKHHISPCEKCRTDSLENKHLMHLCVKQYRGRKNHPRCTEGTCTRLPAYGKRELPECCPGLAGFRCRRGS